jgi:BASS family bile acid:Na+ symporter
MPGKIMASIVALLRNRSFLLIMALVLGLAIGKPWASLVQPTVLPLLALVMVISALSISRREFTSVERVSRVVLFSLLINYVLLGGLILLLATWFITDYEIWVGFVALAFVPPATAVVPFSYALGGDVSFSLIGMTGAYLAALIIMPVGLAYLLGSQIFDPLSLLLVLGELIVIPIIVSRALVYLGVSRYIERYRGAIINWALSIITFSIIGVNRQAFISDFDVLIKTSIIAFSTTFLLAHLLEVGARALHAKHETTVSIMMMGTTKNWSMAGGLLLAFYSERSAIPPSIFVFFAIFMIVWLEYYFRKHARS